MKVYSIEFTDSWSWGLTFRNILAQSPELTVERIFMNNQPSIQPGEADVVLAQNVTLLKKFTERLKTVCRMGGNYNFTHAADLEPLLREMSRCACLVATNRKLYKIAQAVHDNVHLVPSGLDLAAWTPVAPPPDDSPFVVGFCANISNPEYRHYKGYDFVRRAVSNLGPSVELRTALYQDAQIPHDQMRELFYSQIHCLVHPTLGEGCSNTLMEAAACGVPVVTTACAGFHGELFKPGFHALFCQRSVQSIQRCVYQLKQEPGLRRFLSRNIRTFAEQHHDIRLIAVRYEEIFKEVASCQLPVTSKNQESR